MEHTDRSGTAGGATAASTPVFRHLVTFRLARDTFALPVEPVRQILPMLAITPLPESAGTLADSVLGAINLQGRVVPVIDMRRHIGLEHATLERDTPLVVARAGELTIALVVDEVTDVVAVRAAHITPPGDMLPQGLGLAPVLSGLVREPGAPSGRFILLLDTQHLFAPEQREVLARAVELLHARVHDVKVGV